MSSEADRTFPCLNLTVHWLGMKKKNSVSIYFHLWVVEARTRWYKLKPWVHAMLIIAGKVGIVFND